MVERERAVASAYFGANDIGEELAKLCRLASRAEALDLRRFIHRRLTELSLGYRNVVDANVGTEDGDAASPDGAGLVAAALPWAIELSAQSDTHTFDVACDLARIAFGRSAAALAIRLRWTGVLIGIFGVAVPMLAVFVVHWATVEVGQYALAYKWPRWLEVWVCAGFWLTVSIELLWFASMQRKMALLALRQLSTLWAITISGIWTAGLVSLFQVGVHKDLWVVLPMYIALMLFFPLIAMADALPPKLRLRILRFLGPVALGAIGANALALRLPTAADTPGCVIWTVMGSDTLTNLQALAYSSSVLAMLLVKGVMRSWVFPSKLAFITGAVKVSEHGGPMLTHRVSALSSHQAEDVPVRVQVRDPISGTRTRVAMYLDTVGTKLEAIHSAAARAERLGMCKHIRLHLRELQLQYAHAEDGPNLGSCGVTTYADASIGTEAVDIARPRCVNLRRVSTMQVLAALNLGTSAMTIELRPQHGTRTFDVQNDLARMVCGRSASALAVQLRWPTVSIAVLGAVMPVMAIFVVHWANGGLGQFALAYAWPLWLEVWVCMGWWSSVALLLLWYASMQRQIAWMALTQFSTVWVIAMTVVFVTGLVSLWEFGVHQSTWVVLPVYIGCVLVFPLVSMADALPPTLRVLALRFAGPFVLGCAVSVALVLRLPTAEATPGKILWTVMGTDTIGNLQAVTYSCTVMALLLAKGVLRAWVFPDTLAFIQMNVLVAIGADSDFAPQEMHRASAAKVAPHPLDPSSFRP